MKKTYSKEEFLQWQEAVVQAVLTALQEEGSVTVYGDLAEVRCAKMRELNVPSSARGGLGTSVMSNSSVLVALEEREIRRPSRRIITRPFKALPAVVTEETLVHEFFNKRVADRLEQGGIGTLGQLLERRREEGLESLLAIRGFGPNSLVYVQTVLDLLDEFGWPGQISWSPS